MTSEGRIVEQSDSASAENYTKVIGVALQSPTVNGQAVELDIESSYIFGDVAQIIHCLGQLKEPVIEEDPKIPAKDENPKTGETDPVALMASLLVLSAVALVAIVPKKKYNI